MQRFELNGWFVDGNELSISLMRFYVSINLLNQNGYISYRVRVKQDQDELIFNFRTLEEAYTFVYSKVNKSRNLDEVANSYFAEKEEEEQTSKITLTPDEVDWALFSYFGSGKNYQVSVASRLETEQRQPKIIYYLIERYEYDGVKRENKTRLTNGDIKTALQAYVEFYNYDLVDYKFIGGVHSVGYYLDEDTPYYEGIEITVKSKDVDKKLTFNNQQNKPEK